MIKLQLVIFFLFGFISWNGVDTLISHAEARGQAAMMDIMTIEQIQQIPVSDL